MEQDAKPLIAAQPRPPSVPLKVIGDALNSIFMVINVYLAILVAVLSKLQHARRYELGNP